MSGALTAYHPRVDLGRLPSLIEAVGGVGAAVTIRPVLQKTMSSTVSEGPFEVSFVAGWEISFETLNGPFTVSGETVREAVDGALAHPEAWS
jgi:hypothetical protein